MRVGVLLIAASSALCGACATSHKHLDSRPWRESFAQFSKAPVQWVPTAVALAATPILAGVDQSLSISSVEEKVFNTKARYGDEWSMGLGLAPIAIGAAVGLTSGDSRFFEVATEATLLTAAQTQILKLAVNRQRPDRGGEDSFPSGHTSFAFGGATLLARWWAYEHEGDSLGYLLYVPAAYVGVTRLEGERHFLSDITFGAALGIFTAHMVWNAHFGDDEHPGLFGRHVDARIVPVVSEEGVGIGLSISF
ncbi:MAG: phosphatase PAP2 family protein [Planctomycetes bacterium]|nr:phosphatase PAP2 family protein [Planctomycetota bacterium]